MTEEAMVVILPFRNEAEVIQSTLSRLIDEILMDGNCKLVLVDSASEDNSAQKAEKILLNSKLDEEMWSMINIDVPGKCRALNTAMSSVEKQEIVVIVDADARISSGSLRSLRHWISNEEIGAVSAQELVSIDHPMREYKTRSNIIRRYESSVGSCIVLEGSLLAWHPSRIGWQTFDERSNADDTQISLSTIRSGYKSIVDPSINYQDMRKESGIGFQRSIRRSQGLTRQLIRNIDLLWVVNCRASRKNMMFNILLHLIVPWCVLFLLFVPITDYFLLEKTFQPGSFHEITLIPPVIIIFSLLTKTGRVMILGSMASVIGQLREFLGLGAAQWEPGKG